MRQNHPLIDIPYDHLTEYGSKSTILLHKWSRDLDTAWHVHTRGQLLYAEGGVTRLYVADGNFMLPPGHCAWIPAHLAHRVTSPSSHLFLRTLYFETGPEDTDSFFGQVSIFKVHTLLHEMILYTERWAKEIQETKEEISFLQTLKYILPHLRGSSLGLHLPATEHPRLKEILDYLMEHLTIKHPLQDVAKMFALSTRTVSRLFQQELELSVTGFLKIARMIKAVELLSLPGSTIAETAYLVGYESTGSFSNAFLEVVGCRPQAFLVRKERKGS